MPPTAPIMPPKPTTDPTARRGNMSEAIVKMLAEKPWCAAQARPSSSTAVHMSSTTAAKTIGTTHSAMHSIAVLRARLIE